MEDLLFSVAIITYNQEKYISQTLDSILQQEHSFKYEIVIGDDCSTDETQEIIKKYAEKYPDIIKPIFNNPNLGIIKNYFNVINHCSGKYIMECAGDDFWLPGKVEKQIKFMETHPDIGMCYGQAREWIEEKNSFGEKLFGSKKETIDSLLKGNNIPALTVCFRNNLIKAYIEEVSPLRKNWKMEDYPQWLWFSLRSKIFFLEDILGVYRNLNDSACHIKNINKQFLFNKNYYEIASYFASLAKIDFHVVEDDEIYFYIYWKILKDQYSLDVYRKLTYHFKKIKNKSLSLYLRKIIAKYEKLLKYLG